MQRIAELLRAEIARVLRDESHDPRIELLSVTRVEVRSDLSSANVFWSPLDVVHEVDVERMQEGLAAAAGFVRSRLAQNLDLRRTPALHFHYDPAIKAGSRTLALLREIGEDEADRGEKA